MSTDPLKQLQEDLKSLHQSSLRFQKLDLKQARALKDADGILRQMPDGPAIGKAISEWQGKARQVIDRLLQERRADFRRLVADFIKTVQSEQISTREYDGAWRVGPVEIQLRPESAEVQMRYNEETIIKWTSIAGLEDLRQTYKNAVNQLSECRLALPDATDLFWNA